MSSGHEIIVCPYLHFLGLFLKTFLRIVLSGTNIFYSWGGGERVEGVSIYMGPI